MDISLVRVRLNTVPSFLNLDYARFPPSKVSRIREQWDQSGETSYILWANKNLEAFVAFLHQDMDTSETCNTWVLTRYPKNIQATVMKCLLLHTQGQVDQFNVKLRELQDLSADEYLITAAKSENAFACSRMGRKFYGTAVSMYEEVIEKYPTEFAWKYGLGVTLRERLSDEIIHDLNAAPVTFRDAKRVFELVAENDDVEDNLRALCYVGLATLHCRKFARTDLLTNMSPNNAKKLAREYFRKANVRVNGNVKVLTETGKAYRKMEQFDEAKITLKKARRLMPTSSYCHQVGLVLQKTEGALGTAIRYLEESMGLSRGTNLTALRDLGKAYHHNKQYEDAIKVFTSLTETDSYFYKRAGFSWKARCLKKLRRPGQEESKRKAVRYAVMDYLKITPVAEREKISLDQLLPNRGTTSDRSSPDSQRNPFSYFYSALDNFRYLFKVHKISLDYLKELNRLRRAPHQELRNLVQRFYNDDRYDVCLDLVMLLMMTDVEDSEKLAVTTILNIIEKEGDSGQLVSECFKHIIDSLISEEINGHVRLIYDTENCLEEAIRVKTVLERAGLVVKKNDEGVLPFTDRTRHLAQAMSTNVVIICLFKNNNTNFLDTFPIDALANNRPVVLSMSINGSNISPILQNRGKLSCPEQEGNGRWLKEFGEKMLNPLLEDLTTENHHA